jgi:stringent starvation protein B
MLSNKPYLIRAFYDWIVDSACTPYIMVNAAYPRCKVPQEFVENNEITLNISPEAIRDLKITKDAVEFRASFSGIVHIISAPIKSVLAIYAHENQQGMFFDYEEEEGGDDEWATSSIQETTEEAPREKKRPAHLRLVE